MNTDNSYVQGYFSEGAPNPFQEGSADYKIFEDGKRVRARHDAEGVEASAIDTPNLQSNAAPKVVAQQQQQPSMRHNMRSTPSDN